MRFTEVLDSSLDSGSLPTWTRLKTCLNLIERRSGGQEKPQSTVSIWLYSVTKHLQLLPGIQLHVVHRISQKCLKVHSFRIRRKLMTSSEWWHHCWTSTALKIASGHEEISHDACFWLPSQSIEVTLINKRWVLSSHFLCWAAGNMAFLYFSFCDDNLRRVTTAPCFQTDTSSGEICHAGSSLQTS